MNIKPETETAWGSPLAKMAHKNTSVMPKTLAEANALTKIPMGVNKAFVLSDLLDLKEEADIHYATLTQFAERRDLGLALNQLASLSHNINKIIKKYE